jgi:hypothetical protein
MEKWQLIKDVLAFAFLAGLMAALAANVFVSWRNDIRRHKEVTSFIELFQDSNKRLIIGYANVLSSLAAQKTIFVFRDEDGRLVVKALDTAGEKRVVRELEKQEREEDQGAGE